MKTLNNLVKLKAVLLTISLMAPYANASVTLKKEKSGNTVIESATMYCNAQSLKENETKLDNSFVRIETRTTAGKVIYKHELDASTGAKITHCVNTPLNYGKDTAILRCFGYNYDTDKWDIWVVLKNNKTNKLTLESTSIDKLNNMRPAIQYTCEQVEYPRFVTPSGFSVGNN